jgi:hypothetical protein
MRDACAVGPFPRQMQFLLGRTFGALLEAARQTVRVAADIPVAATADVAVSHDSPRGGCAA